MCNDIVCKGADGLISIRAISEGRLVSYRFRPAMGRQLIAGMVF